MSDNTPSKGGAGKKKKKKRSGKGGNSGTPQAAQRPAPVPQPQATPGGKKKKKRSKKGGQRVPVEQLRRHSSQANLSTLQRLDPGVSAVLHIAPFVVMYRLEAASGAWASMGCEGAAFLAERASAPRFKMLVLNRSSPEDFELTLDAVNESETDGGHSLYLQARGGEVYCAWFHEEADTDEFHGILEGLAAEMGGAGAGSPQLQPLQHPSYPHPAPPPQHHHDPHHLAGMLHGMHVNPSAAAALSPPPPSGPAAPAPPPGALSLHDLERQLARSPGLAPAASPPPPPRGGGGGNGLTGAQLLSPAALRAPQPHPQQPPLSRHEFRGRLLAELQTEQGVNRLYDLYCRGSLPV